MSAPTVNAKTSAHADLPLGRRALSWWRRHVMAIYSICALLYLLTPVIWIAVFSFNKPLGRQNTSWNKFSLEAWTNICRDQTICTSVKVSFEIGIFITIVAVIMGTLITYAIVRQRFAGRASTEMLIFLPMATPEVIMGSALLTLFLNLLFHLGFWTISIAHIMFTISFIVVVVKARLGSMDPRLEQAAQDLYATPQQAFRYVTFPILMPGILAAALLGFSLSFDDFIITNFVNGTTVTFPMYIWGAAQRGIPPQVNVIATLMFVGSLTLVAIGALIARARRKPAI
jgi:spermidine/putrescine transport system permease protein